MNPQRVDPFIPVGTPRQTGRAYPGLVNNIPRPRVVDTQRRVLDIVQPRPQHIAPSEPRRTQSVARPQTSTIRNAPPAPIRRQLSQSQAQSQPVVKAKRRPKHRILRSLRTPAFAILIMIAGMLVQSAAFGEILIAVYTIFALWKRIPSRTSFLLALLSLIGVVVLLLVKTNDSLAATFTIYTFLLLGTGVLSILKEMRAENA